MKKGKPLTKKEILRQRIEELEQEQVIRDAVISELKAERNALREFVDGSAVEFFYNSDEWNEVYRKHQEEQSVRDGFHHAVFNYNTTSSNSSGAQITIENNYGGEENV